MKRLYKNTKDNFNLLALVIALLVSPLQANTNSPKALVNNVQGNVFVTHGDKTKKLKTGDHLYDFDEVFTETGAQVSFSDYEDHQYHLSGSGHVRVMNKIVELKRGYLWMQSHGGKTSPSYIQTANAQTMFTHGEVVISFDQYSGKTQILSVKGSFEFANLLESHLMTMVPSGKFSFISKDYENGSPRSPTPVGKLTYEKITGLFNGVKPATKSPEMEFVEKYAAKPAKKTVQKKREIASVASDAPPTKGQGQIIYFKNDPEVTELKQKLLWKYYEGKVKKMVPKKKVEGPDFTKRTTAEVVVYGEIGKTYTEVAKKLRMPASASSKVGEMVKAKEQRKRRSRRPASLNFYNPQVKVNKDMFESSLLDEYKKQMRHSNEVNSLIDELKSYDQDYKAAH